MQSLFPWYDDYWLSAYVQAKHFLATVAPDKYLEFIETLEPLRTSLEFQVSRSDDLFRPALLII